MDPIENKKIIVHHVGEAGCYGAALLACSAMEKIPVEKLIRHSGSGNKVFSPNPEYAKLYDQKFERYQQLYPVLTQFWR